MQNNKLNQKKILEKIIHTFPDVVGYTDIVNCSLEGKLIDKLPVGMATGNYEVYKICCQGNAETEETENGILFLFPGSGIAPHLHALENGISEIYKTIGYNKFHYEGKEFDFYECELGEVHGIDVEDTPRAIQYIKTNELLKKDTRPIVRQKKK